jgi:mRNA interferase HigB
VATSRGRVEKASWTGPADVRATFGTAAFLPDSRVVFNIKGNAYRIVAQIKCGPLCEALIAEELPHFIRFIGIHAEYDRIDATDV